MMKRLFLLMILGVTSVLCLNAQTKSLHQLQQEFVDLRCGMFIHFNMPTFLMRTGRTRMLLPSFSTLSGWTANNGQKRQNQPT